MYMHTTVSVYSATRLKKRFENGQHATTVTIYAATVQILRPSSVVACERERERAKVRDRE
jgi:hypothetical protein